MHVRQPQAGPLGRWGRVLVYESDRPLTPLAANQTVPLLLRAYIQYLDADGAPSGGSLPTVATNPSARAFEPAISGNGLWVAFTTSGAYSPYAEPGREYDRCGCSDVRPHANDDVYMADLRFPNFAPNNPRLISQVPGPLGNVGNGQSGQPSLNYDGSIVTFTSRSTDLITGGDPGGAAPSVFRREVDQVTTDPFLSPIAAGGTTTLVATATGGRAVHESAVSSDGNRVAYTVSEPVLSLSPPSPIDFGEVSTSTFAVQGITLANTGGGDMPWTLALEGPNASEFEATHSCAATLFGRESCSIAVRLTPTGTGPRTTTLRITTAVGAPVATSKTLTLSGVGVAGAPATTVPPTTPTTTPPVVPPDTPLDANGADDVYVKDLHTNTLIAVTPRTPALCGGCGPRDARNPDLSDDGSTVAFESASGDLHAGDTNENDDVFVRVVSSPVGPIERASLTLQQLELQAGAESRNAALSADGTYVTFDTDAESPGPTSTAAIPTPSWPVTSPPTAVAAAQTPVPSTSVAAAAIQPVLALAVPGATRDVFERRRDPIPFFDLNAVNLSGVEIGTDSTPQTVTLRNTGPAPVRLLDSPTVTAGAWRIVAGAGTTCATGLTLYRGQACTVQVVVHPTSTGPSVATLTVPVSAGPNLLPGAPVPPITATLTAPGVAPTFTYTSTLEFGTVPPGTPSGLQPVTITNTGANSQAVGPVSITGPNAADFTIDPTSTCGSAPLPPGGSCVVYVRFTPSGTGSRSASLASTFAGTPFTVPLAGTGTPTTTIPTTIPLPTVSIQPSPVDFGVADMGAAPVSRTATVTNQGPGDASVYACLGTKTWTSTSSPGPSSFRAGAY